MTSDATVTEHASYPTGAAARLGYEQRAYDDWYRSKATRFERPFYYHHHPEYERAFVRALLSKHHVRPGSRLIDLGCGNGFYSNAFSECGLRVTAVDLSDAIIDYARRTRPEPVDWIAGDAFSLPFENEFDYAFCHFFTFFNASDQLSAFADYGRAMMRYLKPGGTLWFVWHTDLTAVRLPADRFSIMNFTIPQLESLFPEHRVQSYAVDGLSRMPRYLGRFAFNKYVSRLCCAGVALKADNWHRVRVVVAAHKEPV
jgi:SAM-dependent methyltransferase